MTKGAAMPRDHGEGGLLERMTQAEADALESLLQAAEGHSGQSKRCADFLLSWWNADACGGWHPTDLWAVDQKLSDAMLVVLDFISRNRIYPDRPDVQPRFIALVERWCPDD
jgi:hypothetical protein